MSRLLYELVRGMKQSPPAMPLSARHHASPLLLWEYPTMVPSSVWLYYKLTRCPHVFLEQFVCVAQEDYWRILNHVEKNTHKVEEEGEIVMVKEHRELDRSGTRKGHIVIKVSCRRFLWEPIAIKYLTGRQEGLWLGEADKTHL